MTIKILHWSQVGKGRDRVKVNYWMLIENGLYVKRQLNLTGEKVYDKEDYLVCHDRNYVIAKLTKDLSDLSDLSLVDFLALMTEIHSRIQGSQSDIPF